MVKKFPKVSESIWELQGMALDGEPAKHLNTEGLMVKYKGVEVRTERYPFWKKFLKVPNFKDTFPGVEISFKDKQDFKILLVQWVGSIEMEWMELPAKRGFYHRHKKIGSGESEILF